MRRIWWVIVACIVASTTASAQVPIVSTVAGGGGEAGCPPWWVTPPVGDGLPATSVCLNHPSGIAVDSGGNLYIVDQFSDRIRKVDATTGIITTVAGGNPAAPDGGLCGDGGPATNACLHDPRDVAVDVAGNLYIADRLNHRIRKVDPAGIITTLAGSGPSYPAPGSGGFCGDGGPATSACLSGPMGVAVDVAGNVFIADRDNRRVRKVDRAGVITTVAGGGTANPGDGGPATSAFIEPMELALDATGALFIANYSRVRRVDARGIITTVAGPASACPGDGGPATSACFQADDVTVDAAGNLFIADTAYNRIRKVDAAGIITTVAGGGTPPYPVGFCGDGWPATTACLNGPTAVTVDPAGNFFIADTGNRRIRMVADGPMPDDLASVWLKQTLVAGCVKLRAEVRLRRPVPAGGLRVALHSDNPHALVPSSLVMEPGVLTKAFLIPTTAVTMREPVTIEASALGQVVTNSFTVRPIGPKGVTLSPNPVRGGTPVAATVTLECAAAPGDITLTLFSSKPLVATPDVTSLTIPAGGKTAAFGVTSRPVPVMSKASIKAKANDITKSRTLTVDP